MLLVQPSMAEPTNQRKKHRKTTPNTLKIRLKKGKTRLKRLAWLPSCSNIIFSLTRSSRFSMRKESLSKERIGGMPCAHPSRGNVAAGGIPLSPGLPAKSVHFSTTLPVVQRSGAWQNQFEFSHATRASGKFYRAGCSSAHEGHQESELRVLKNEHRHSAGPNFEPGGHEGPRQKYSHTSKSRTMKPSK